VRSVRELRLWEHIFEPLVGWLLTALAAMLGAPFWFDLLNRMMVVRSTVKPHEKSPEESSEDRQAPRDHSVYVTAAPVARETVEVHTAPVVVEPPPDPDAEVDACDVAADATTRLTDDVELPVARGGVA
jgi:hypothetical protein